MSRTAIDLRLFRPGRVLILKPSSLGDVVHALPTLAALKAHWPNARIAWLVNRGLRGLLEGNPALDEVIPFDRGALKPSLAGVRAIGRVWHDLRSRRFDLAIDLQGLLRSGLMTAATGAPVRVGLASAREGATRFYTHQVGPPAGSEHAVDRLLEVAKAFGADVTHPRFDAAMSDDDRAWARGVLAPVGRPVLVLNVGARWLTKRWPPSQFAEVARRARETLGAGLVAVGAPEDRELVKTLREGLGSIPLLDLCGRTTLPQLAALAREADLFLSNDTGPLHLAAATGAPVLGVYTCTKPEWTGPYGPSATSVRSGIWCAGSCVKSCGRMECMAELTPDRVWSAARAILSRPGSAEVHAA